MVSDDPESFADLDGHATTQMYQLANPAASSAWDPMGANPMTDESGLTPEEYNALEAVAATEAAQKQAQNTTHTEAQTQPKLLSAEDVSNAIQSAKNEPKGTPHAKEIVDFLNSFGTNWNLSGDTLRQALKDSKVNAHGVDKKVDSISRTGDVVTVKIESSYKLLDL